MTCVSRACARFRNFSHARGGDEAFLEGGIRRRGRLALERTDGKVPRPGGGDGAAPGETGGGVAARTGEVSGICGTNDARKGASDPRASERSGGPGYIPVRNGHCPLRRPPLSTLAGEYPGRDAGGAIEARCAFLGSAGAGAERGEFRLGGLPTADGPAGKCCLVRD